MKRLLLLLLCALSLPLTARVLSYSPYTDQISGRGFQLRTTRHFVLVEMGVYDRRVRYGQVVLYDSKGIDAPRMVFPQGKIYFAALYQDDDELPPVILVATAYPKVSTHLSRDGGRTWRQLTELDGLVPHQPDDVDYGGPWTQGLSASVRIGTRGTPFVVSYEGGVYAIQRFGPPRLMAKTLPTIKNYQYYEDYGRNRLVGQNREGTEFLIVTDADSLTAVGLDGRWRPIGKVLPDLDAAWITPDGSVYAVVHDGYEEWNEREDFRELYLYRNRKSERVYGDFSPYLVAVPTHDFSGAWLSNQDRWQDSTELMLHTPAGGLETMWVARGEEPPQIEALHPGASGKTVLIQVHRPRVSATNFIDPALAVWTIGTPAPDSYDELFVREGPYKGFVHLDVDRMNEGEPFVFDSSFIRPPAPEPVSAPIIPGGEDILQESGVVRSSLKQLLLVPGAIREPGRWLTDLTIYNPLDETQDVAVTFDGVTKTVTIPRNEIRVLCDVLGTLFDVEEGSGTLHLEPKVGINVKARVYTTRDGGTRGYTIGAIDFFNVTSPRFPVTFSGAFPGSGFTTKLLLTDTSSGGLEADVTTTNYAGSPTTASLEAKSVREELLPSPGVGGLLVRPAAGMGVAGVVVVDERSGDPTYFPPDLSTDQTRTIPFLAHVEEADGSVLRSDLHIVNFSNASSYVHLEAKPYSTQDWPKTHAYMLKAFESRVIEDPVKTIFGLTGLVRLRYYVYGNYGGDKIGVRVTSRTYRTGPDGGTSGTLVPPMNAFQSVTYGEALDILVPGGNFKVTLGLVDNSPDMRGRPTDVRVDIYDERSHLLHSFRRTLQPTRGEMIEDLFATMKIAPRPASRIVVEALDNSGLVSAYVLLTDRITGDLSFVGPNLGATK